MPQDSESGARAVNFGFKNAQRTAKEIGAQLLTPSKSNLASHNGRRVVLKSARTGNNFVGVPYSLLSQVSAVIAALEDSPAGTFVIFEISRAQFEANQKPQPGREVGQVARAIFYSLGKKIGRFTIADLG